MRTPRGSRSSGRSRPPAPAKDAGTLAGHGSATPIDPGPRSKSITCTGGIGNPARLADGPGSRVIGASIALVSRFARFAEAATRGIARGPAVKLADPAGSALEVTVERFGFGADRREPWAARAFHRASQTHLHGVGATPWLALAELADFYRRTVVLQEPWSPARRPVGGPALPALPPITPRELATGDRGPRKVATIGDPLASGPRGVRLV